MTPYERRQAIYRFRYSNGTSYWAKPWLREQDMEMLANEFANLNVENLSEIIQEHVVQIFDDMENDDWRSPAIHRGDVHWLSATIAKRLVERLKGTRES